MIHASSGIHINNVNDEPTSILRSNTQESIMAVSSNDLDQSETNAQNLVNQPIQTNDTIETQRNTAVVSTEILTTQEESLAEEHSNSRGRVDEETGLSWEIVVNRETNMAENIEEWSPNAFEETVESWHSLVSHHITGPHLVSGRRTNRFSHTDDDRTYGVEIRELLSRYFPFSNSFIIFISRLVQIEIYPCC
jgi:hypothetical protein